MKPGCTPTEWQQMRSGDLSYVGDAVTSITPFTGLTANALAHLRREWVSWESDSVHIRVPDKASCNSFKSRSGGKSNSSSPPQVIERSNPCSFCEQKGEANQFESLRNNNPTESFRTVLHRDIAAPAVEFLEMVFQTYDRPELAVHTSTLYNAANDIVEDTPAGDYSYSKLKRTAPVIYAHYGLSPENISKLTPYEVGSIKQIVQRTPSVNFENHSTVSFLRAVVEMEPVTVSDLAEELGLTRGPVHKRLKGLQEEGRVMATGNTRPGRPAATWETTDSWTEPFRCDKCGFEARSLNGFQTHKAVKHGYSR